MDIKKFLFIRHGKTQGNVERRYIGDPGEPLCGEGIREVKALARAGLLPPVTALISGPALRCRQTAELLFPGAVYTVCPLEEIDFGAFKGKNAGDLRGNPEYEQWLATNCMGDIPGGGSVTEFKNQCGEFFMNLVKTSGAGTTALVIHGGNIMAIMERFACPQRDFYAYHIPNGGFMLCRFENGALRVEPAAGPKRG